MKIHELTSHLEALLARHDSEIYIDHELDSDEMTIWLHTKEYRSGVATETWKAIGNQFPKKVVSKVPAEVVG